MFSLNYEKVTYCAVYYSFDELQEIFLVFSLCVHSYVALCTTVTYQIVPVHYSGMHHTD
jgi:hypothetical protein